MRKKKMNPLKMGELEILDTSELLKDIDDLIKLDEEVEIPHGKGVDDKPDYSRQGLEERGFWGEQIEEIESGISQQLPVEHYARECYNWMQMREIRLGLLEKLPTEIYENPYFSAEQMHEIRMGCAEGLDVSGYAKLSLSARDMERARKKLLQKEYSRRPQGFAAEWEDQEDGVKIRVSDDGMEAYLTFMKEPEYSLREIKKILARNDVVFGVLDENLEEALKNKRVGQEIIAARGEKEEKGSDGKYAFFFNPLLPGGPRELEDGSVDYTRIVEADRVNAGNVLAQYYPAVHPKNGRTVTGIEVEGKMGKNLPPLTGKGFRFNREDNTYVAAMDGFVLVDEEKNTLNVWNVFVVHGDVNRYNGHISYDGIIHIQGNVGDMAMISASGNIVIDGVVEGAHLVAGENVIIKGGINGGERGTIQAGRKVMGKFFESVQIHAGSNVEGNYFMNCTITTDGQLLARGKKGRIIGGKLQILGGVEAVSIGNYNSTKTILDVGNVLQTEERRVLIQTKMNKVEKELAHLESGRKKISDMLGAEFAETNELYKKTCKAISVLETQKQELEMDARYLDALAKRAAGAVISVRGSLQEGVKVIIYGRRKDISKTMTGRIIIKRETKGE